MTEINAERKERGKRERPRGRQTGGRRDIGQRDRDRDIDRERKNERLVSLCSHVAFLFTPFCGNVILSIHM